jgi:hypothetical protein
MDHVSHPYKTTGNIILYVLIFVFLDSRIKQKFLGKLVANMSMMMITSGSDATTHKTEFRYIFLIIRHI